MSNSNGRHVPESYYERDTNMMGQGKTYYHFFENDAGFEFIVLDADRKVISCNEVTCKDIEAEGMARLINSLKHQCTKSETAGMILTDHARKIAIKKMMQNHETAE